MLLFYLPENTALRIIPRRGLPRVECAHGNPWPGGRGNTCAPTVNNAWEYCPVNAMHLITPADADE